jgi:hypothetical protein
VELRQLRQLLQQLDTSPRSLLITLRTSGQQQRQLSAIEGSGRISNGSTERRGDMDIHVEQRQRSDSRGGDQQVRALEGMAAYIGEGLLQPVATGYGDRVLVPVESGFYATARVIGNQVVVDIDQRDDRIDDGGTDRRRNRASDSRIHTSGLRTQVRGELGQWISLGGSSRQSGGDRHGLGGYRSDSASWSSDSAIKVELLQ